LTEFLAERVHYRLHHVRPDVGLVSPHVGKESGTTNDHALMLSEIVEKLELQGGQIDALAVEEQLSLAHVEQVVLGRPSSSAAMRVSQPSTDEGPNSR
jgi:hypothetical protein